MEKSKIWNPQTWEIKQETIRYFNKFWNKVVQLDLMIPHCTLHTYMTAKTPYRFSSVYLDNYC